MLDRTRPPTKMLSDAAKAELVQAQSQADMFKTSLNNTTSGPGGASGLGVNTQHQQTSQAMDQTQREGKRGEPSETPNKDNQGQGGGKGSNKWPRHERVVGPTELPEQGAAEVWKKAKAEMPETLTMPLRFAMLHSMLQIWHERMKVTMQSPESIANAKEMLILDGDCRVPYLQYNAQEKKMMIKTDRAPMEFQEVLTALETLQTLTILPLTVLRFHSTRRMEQDLKGETLANGPGDWAADGGSGSGMVPLQSAMPLGSMPSHGDVDESRQARQIGSGHQSAEDDRKHVRTLVLGNRHIVHVRTIYCNFAELKGDDMKEEWAKQCEKARKKGLKYPQRKWYFAWYGSKNEATDPEKWHHPDGFFPLATMTAVHRSPDRQDQFLVKYTAGAKETLVYRREQGKALDAWVEGLDLANQEIRENMKEEKEKEEMEEKEKAKAKMMHGQWMQKNGMPTNEEQWTAWFQWMKSGHLDEETIRNFYQELMSPQAGGQQRR
eukprot:s1676_g4.t2